MTPEDLKRWQDRMIEEINRSKFAPKPKTVRTTEAKPYTWRATNLTSIAVTEARAKKLARAGEHVSPNPFCNWKKYGLENPLLKASA